MSTTPVQDADRNAFTEFERSGWSGATDGYHRFFGPITGRVADPLLDEAAVRPGSRVLDVATGPGYVAGRAADRGAMTVGVDIAEPFVALAAGLHPECEFHRADAHDLPFADRSFTAVVANFLLPHLADHHRAVKELTRVLRPSGRLAVSTWDVPERSPLLGIVVAAVDEGTDAEPPTAPRSPPPGPPFFAYSTDAALSELLGTAGLDDIRLLRQTFTAPIGSAGELWAGLMGGTVRTSALVRAPSRDSSGARRAFDRLANEYATGTGLAIPVAVRIASGRRPA